MQSVSTLCSLAYVALDQKKWTPLHKVAAEVVDTDICAELVKYGADVNAKDTVSI